MPKHIGIVACSAEGAALCYRTICAEAPAIMGKHMHPEVSLHTHALAAYMPPIDEGNWQGVADLMLSSTRKLAQIGADFAICPDNTIHAAYNLVVPHSPIPWLHIAEVVAETAREQRFRKLAILGTKYLMTSPVYPAALKKFAIAYAIPNETDRELINSTIFKELVNGIFLAASRQKFNQIIEKLKDQECDAVVLGCTEIPLLIDPDDCPLPPLDSTRLLARAAIKKAIFRDS